MDDEFEFHKGDNFLGGTHLFGERVRVFDNRNYFVLSLMTAMQFQNGASLLRMFLALKA